MPISFNEKNKPLIIALDCINGIIINKIACAIQNWLVPVDLYAANDVTRVTKDHIGPCINYGMRKRDMFCWGSVSLIGSPMSGYEQQIYSLSGLSHQFQQVLSSLLLQHNGHIQYSWALCCCFPSWLIICKGNESDLLSFHFPHGGFRCLTERHACTSVVNTSST